MGGHGRPLPPHPGPVWEGVGDLAGASGRDVLADRGGNLGCRPRWARTAHEPTGVGENQKVAQNVASSTNVSSRGSSNAE